MKSIKYYLQPIYWIYVYIPLIGFLIAGYVWYLRISGDIAICKLYYPEMKTAECYFSSKTMKVPNDQR